MYRCGWASNQGREVVFAVRLRRSAFDLLLAQAVHSTYVEVIYHREEAWKSAVEHSNVRLQWDPDHDPTGAKVERRAIQLGMRGEVLAHYAHDWLIEIKDITDFVHEQYQYGQARDYARLITPHELVYPVTDAIVAARLGVG